MAESLKVEFEIDARHQADLCSEAKRLGLTPAEVAQRAVAAWLTDIRENSCCEDVETAGCG